MSSRRRSRPRWTRTVSYDWHTGRSFRPAPCGVTIRVAEAVQPQRGLADVIRGIAADQRSRGFPGRSAADVRAEAEARRAEDDERDRELDAARRGASPGGG